VLDKLQKNRQYVCKELLCKLAWHREHEAGVKRQTESCVISKLAKCEKCNEHFRTVPLVSGIKVAMLNDPTLVDGLAKVLNNIVLLLQRELTLCKIGSRGFATLEATELA
jgi:hypothetical protein